MLVYFIRKCKAFATRKVNANMRHTLALLLPFLLYGCAPSGDSKKTIVASFYPIAFLASEITGNEFEVKTLVPAGSEPHEFELTPRGVAALNDASLILMNGLGMEAWESSLSPSMKEKTITLSQGLETLSIDGRVDPHVWLDTRLYEQMGKKVYEGIVSIDKEHAQIYADNYALFCKKMADLRGYCNEIASSFKQKSVAVNHAAFGYMAAEFGFEQLYINSLSPNEEPTQKAIEDIIEAISSRGIDTVFFEELASDEVAKKIAAETGAKVDSLNPLEGLEESEINRGENYYSVYRENMDKIARAKP